MYIIFTLWHVNFYEWVLMTVLYFPTFVFHFSLRSKTTFETKISNYTFTWWWWKIFDIFFFSVYSVIFGIRGKRNLLIDFIILPLLNSIISQTWCEYLQGFSVLSNDSVEFNLIGSRTDLLLKCLGKSWISIRLPKKENLNPSLAKESYIVVVVVVVITLCNSIKSLIYVLMHSKCPFLRTMN